MKTASWVATAVAAAASLLPTLAQAQSSSLPSIVRKGQYFFYENNGTQFFLRGVAYQQDISSNGTTTGNNDFTDPLTIPSDCQRDFPLLQQLYTNVIRVYAIDATGDHTECMQMLQDAGIYLIADLSQPGLSINRNSPTWDEELYARYTSVVDSLANYTNVIGFFAGNEVSNSPNNTAASAFVKAAVRDTKAYIKQKGYRDSLGVGYAANDDATIRVELADYFNCGDPAQAIDFFGYNIYSWCGKSTFEQSGYAARTEEFSTYNIPAFFAEYGCNTQGTRIFQEVGSLYGPNMTKVFSGGIVYMYFQETNDFGLVTVDGNTASKLPDFSNLQSQLASVTGVTGVNSASYTPSNTAAACPTTSGWAASSNLPPTPNQELCGCMEAALSCVPNNDVDATDYGDLFGTVCGLSKQACVGIAANGTTGEYGAYAMCNPKQQLGWILNAYYAEQTSAGNGASACDFSGSASTQAAVSPTGNCKALISEAGHDGTGTVTSAPTATGNSGSGSASGSASSGSSSGSSSSSGNIAAMGMISPSLNLGYLQVGLYAVVAIGSAGFMIWL